MRIVKTFSGFGKIESENYLQIHGYKNARRIGKSDYFICFSLGKPLNDVSVVFG